MYNRQSKSGYRQSKVRQKSMNPKGFRVGGEHGTFPATLVVPFEVEELGNEHILEEASKVPCLESRARKWEQTDDGTGPFFCGLVVCFHFAHLHE